MGALAIGLAVTLGTLGTLGCAGAAHPAGSAKKYEAPDERFVFFAQSKVDVLPDGYFSIGYVTALLDADPSLHVLIVGHADPKGRGDANRELSFKRARAVRKVLLEHGVKANRTLIASPHEQSESSLEQLSRRADIYVYDPLQDEASKRLGYEIDIKAE
jgi:hypothetical protein